MWSEMPQRRTIDELARGIIPLGIRSATAQGGHDANSWVHPLAASDRVGFLWVSGHWERRCGHLERDPSTACVRVEEVQRIDHPDEPLLPAGVAAAGGRSL